MCGIIGAIAQRNVTPILIEGLKRLAYRGYDSAGMAVLSSEERLIQMLKVKGKVTSLIDALNLQPTHGYVGIAHTRWATHGAPNTVNAHPHCSQDQIVVVHNGIIENYAPLREELLTVGYQFQSETDTEVIAHLLHYQLQKKSNMLSAIQAAVQQLRGAYALGIIDRNTPDRLFALRSGCPLVIGIGIDEHFIASDPLALLPVTQRFIYLEEGDIAQVELKKINIYDHDIQIVNRIAQETDITAESTSKGKFRHFMLKEIFEQPKALAETLDGILINNHIAPQAFGHKATEIFKQIERIQIVACGTSYHAGLVARYWLEQLAHIPCQVEIASEYRYRDIVVEDKTLFVTLSQSGETADTLAALRKAKESGYLATLGICNAPQSTMVRETDLIFITRAGAEVGVAATKTFTAQLTALLTLAIVLKQFRSNDPKEISDLTDGLKQLPHLAKQILILNDKIQSLAKYFADKQHTLFISRDTLFPIALEGALKLKEISYVHAEAYPAGELKHGPLALVDEDMPVVVLAADNNLSEKLLSNIEEIQARGGEIFLFLDEQLKWQTNSRTHQIELPHVPNILAPIIYTIPLQLLAYHIAVLKGTDVDQPRNLAKSVTVE